MGNYVEQHCATIYHMILILKSSLTAKQVGAVPERTAGAAVSAGSAEMPEAECGRLTGTGV